jgi:hypothetical protein
MEEDSSSEFFVGSSLRGYVNVGDDFVDGFGHAATNVVSEDKYRKSSESSSRSTFDEDGGDGDGSEIVRGKFDGEESARQLESVKSMNRTRRLRQFSSFDKWKQRSKNVNSSSFSVLSQPQSVMTSVLSKKTKHGARDWNAEFYEITENMKPGLKRLRALQTFHSAFERFATSYALVIVQELYKKDKAIRPDNHRGSGGIKYRVQNMMFKVAIDSTGIYGGSNETAGKLAKCELKSAAILHQAHVRDLRPPLSCLVDVLGVRIMCSAVVPIDGVETLKIGSCDGGQTVVCCEDEVELRMKAEEAARRLNLKPHIAGIQKSARVPFPADCEFHRGRDGSFYVLDLARLMPVETSMSHLADCMGRFGFSSRRLRPDFVRQFSCPLNTDALTGISKLVPERGESVADLKRATNLMGVRVEKCVDHLQKTFDEESNMTYACQIEHVESEIHRFGINLRHLGLIRSKVTKENNTSMLLDTLLICMIWRTLKNVLRKRLRTLIMSRDKGGRDAAHVIADVFTMLGQCSTKRKLAQSLQKQLIRRFGTCALSDASEIMVCSLSSLILSFDTNFTHILTLNNNNTGVAELW